MLIGICGGICAGKHEVARFLVDEYNFKPVALQARPHSSSSKEPQQSSHASTSSILKTEVLSYATVDELLEYVTPRWRERFVTICTETWSEDVLEALVKRPFFTLISVDAPIVTRWGRYVKRYQSLSSSSSSSSSSSPSSATSEDISLESFIHKSDRHMYGDVSASSSSSSKLVELMSRAAIRLLNPTSSVSILREHLRKLEITNEAKALMRPSWDAYFMQLASLAAQRSNCMKRRVGAVIVRDKRVISTGYNGSPRGMTNCNEGGCKRCNDGAVGGVGLSTCLCMHAEENALLEAGRERIRDGSTLYCDTCPCLTCSIKIVQVGISEVVYGQGYSMDTDTAAVLSEGGVKLRQFYPPKQGVISLGRVEKS